MWWLHLAGSAAQGSTSRWPVLGCERRRASRWADDDAGSSLCCHYMLHVMFNPRNPAAAVSECCARAHARHSVIPVCVSVYVRVCQRCCGCGPALRVSLDLGEMWSCCAVVLARCVGVCCHCRSGLCLGCRLRRELSLFRYLCCPAACAALSPLYRRETCGDARAESLCCCVCRCLYCCACRWYLRFPYLPHFSRHAVSAAARVSACLGG